MADVLSMILVPMAASLSEGFFADDQPPVLEQQGQNGPALLWQWGVRQQRCVPTHDRFGGQHLGLAQARESTAVVTQYGQQSILVSAERFPDQADEFLAARGGGDRVCAGHPALGPPHMTGARRVARGGVGDLRIAERMCRCSYLFFDCSASFFGRFGDSLMLGVAHTRSRDGRPLQAQAFDGPAEKAGGCARLKMGDLELPLGPPDQRSQGTRRSQSRRGGQGRGAAPGRQARSGRPGSGGACRYG